MTATIRLNTTYRDGIIAAAVAARFDQVQADLAARAIELGNRVYETIYDKALRRKVDSLPEDWVVSYDSLRFQVVNRVITFDLGKLRRFPLSSSQRYSIRYVFPEGDELGKECVEVDMLIDQTNKERHKVKEATRHAVYQFSTNKTLIDAWPEIAPIVNKVCGDNDRKIYLPMLPLGELNLMLGLVEGETTEQKNAREKEEAKVAKAAAVAAMRQKNREARKAA